MKVTGPMFSMTASGQIGGVLVASNWKGRAYFRSLVKPANPKSPLQISTRSMFKFLSQNWAALTTAEKATWQTIADQIVASPFNAYMQKNQTDARNFLSPGQQTPILRADTPGVLTTWTATAGVRQITLDIEAAAAGDATWGTVIYRSLTTGFTAAVSNIHAVILSTPAAPVTFVDTPLDPDEYFYRAQPFADDGGKAVLEAEISAVVT